MLEELAKPVGVYKAKQLVDQGQLDAETVFWENIKGIWQIQWTWDLKPASKLVYSGLKRYCKRPLQTIVNKEGAAQEVSTYKCDETCIREVGAGDPREL